MRWPGGSIRVEAVILAVAVGVAGLAAAGEAVGREAADPWEDRWVALFLGAGDLTAAEAPDRDPSRLVPTPNRRVRLRSHGHRAVTACQSMTRRPSRPR